MITIPYCVLVFWVHFHIGVLHITVLCNHSMSHPNFPNTCEIEVT